jgi:hypothetical protein
MGHLIRERVDRNVTNKTIQPDRGFVSETTAR